MSRLGDLGLATANRIIGIAPGHVAPAGRMVDLPGRGATFVTDLDAQPDAQPDAQVDAQSERPTLILLHALATTGQLCWYPVMNALREHYRVITFDQRGHGRGIRAPRFRLTDCADDVVAVADSLEIDRFVAVGYSMGSLVAPLAWRRHPDRVAGLVLGAAAHSFRETRRHRAAHHLMSAAVASRSRQSLPPTLAAQSSGASDERWAYEEFRTTKPSAIGEAIAEIMRYDATPWAHTINVPTSLVVTAQDRVIPPHRQRWLASQIQHATVYEVNAGHAACVLQADVFRPALTVACASVTSRLARQQRPA